MSGGAPTVHEFLSEKWILIEPAVESELRRGWCGLPGWFHIVLGGIGWAAVQAVRNLPEASLLPTSRLSLTSISEATSDKSKQNGDTDPYAQTWTNVSKTVHGISQLSLTEEASTAARRVSHTFILKLRSGFVRE